MVLRTVRPHTAGCSSFRFDAGYRVFKELPQTAHWSVPRRYTVALAIFVVALVLRLALLPISAGLGFLTFYPALMVGFLLCGIGPGILIAVASTIASYTIFFEPYWTFDYNRDGVIAASVFLLSSTLLALIVNALHVYLARAESEASHSRLLAAEIRQSEQRYRAVVEDQTEIICRYLCDGTLVFVNEAFRRLVGKSSTELLGQRWDACLLPEDLPHVRDQLNHLSAQHAVVTIECRVATPRQEIRWLQFVNRALFDDRGRLLETQAVARDITERKRLEQALESARDSAVQANEVKSRFLAAASHDLRQPLQTIWSLQGLLSRVLKDSAYGPQIALLGEAVQGMDTLLSALIDINRLEIGAIQPVIRDVPLQSILASLHAEWGPSAAEKSIGFEVEDSAAYVRSDPMLLPVMLRNLIGDAIKNTQAGTVRLQVRPAAEHICIDVGVDGAPRVSPDNAPRMGSGLPIVQTIATLLNHAVSIRSTGEAGTTFTVRLDRGADVNGSGTPLPAPPAVAAPHAAGAKRILHIEDDPAVARSMAMLLSLEGYEVAGAASRDEALQQIGERGFRPDLILCDFQFPQGVTGDAIVSEIAARLKFRPPTILLTGDIANKHIKRAGLVADRIFAKPVNINTLLQECETLLAPVRHTELGS